MTDLPELFRQRLTPKYLSGEHDDICEHMPMLYYLARQCYHITEFGVRTGNSTIAFLHGLNDRGSLTSYDIQQPTREIALRLGSSVWHFHQADTARLEDITPTDLLFIDTKHTYDHVRLELKHARRVRKWLVMHDTQRWGKQGEDNQAGILPAIDEFRRDNPEWDHVWAEFWNCNGLLILERK